MKQRSKDLGRCATGVGVAMLGILGVFETTSCLVPDVGYCAYAYGDWSCPEARGVCVLAKERASHEEIDNGCSADVPEGFVHAPYGLPLVVVEPDDDPYDPRSVEGVLAKLGYQGCGTADELEAHFRRVIDGVAHTRRHLEERGHVRRAAIELSDRQVVAIEAFNDAVAAWLDGCSSEVGTDTDATSTAADATETEAESTASATGGPCEDEDCLELDPSRPFCDPNGMCVDCDGMPDPDGACAMANSSLPACVNGVCEECEQANTTACDDQLLVCDVMNHVCVSCTEHEQCEAGACDLLADDPTCFDPDPNNVLEVGLEHEYSSIANALMYVEMMRIERPVLHLYDDTPPDEAAFDEAVTISAGVIAFVGASGERLHWIKSGGSGPTLEGSGGGTRAYLNGIWLDDSNDVGLVCDGGRVHVSKSAISRSALEGIFATNGCTLYLVNSFVGGGGDDDPALSSSNATVVSTYATFYNSSFDSTPALLCTGSDVTLRNSIIVTQGGAVGTELDCLGADVSYTAAEGLVSGLSNEGVGQFPDGSPTLWFANVNESNFHLQNDGLEVFANIAEWREGDPSTDIDGEPRPTVKGPDYPGADNIP